MVLRYKISVVDFNRFGVISGGLLAIATQVFLTKSLVEKLLSEQRDGDI